MSRRDALTSVDIRPREFTPAEAEAIEQSLDAQMIEHVKELLCTLWKQGRVNIDVRMMGEHALSAALHVVENPELRNLTPQQGMTLSNQQWQRDQRRNSRDF